MSTSRFFAGALVGLVAGLLLAPEKGEEMRNDVVDTAQKWKKKINRMVGKTGAELSDLRSMLSEEIEGLNEDVRNRILTIIDETSNSAENIKRNFATEMQ